MLGLLIETSPCLNQPRYFVGSRIQSAAKNREPSQTSGRTSRVVTICLGGAMPSMTAAVPPGRTSATVAAQAASHLGITDIPSVQSTASTGVAPLGGRQRHGRPGAAARVVGGLDVATVGARKAPRDRQTEARATGGRRAGPV
jgi:hypothetical protein